jgi:hypothetical protein
MPGVRSASAMAATDIRPAITPVTTATPRMPEPMTQTATIRSPADAGAMSP